MYEQVSHSLLNSILNTLPADLIKSDLRHFYTRLGANFYAIYSLMKQLYGQRDDFNEHMQKLVEVMARQYQKRSQTLHELDLMREKNHNWFLDQQWVGMALYSDGFAGDLQGLRSKLSYFQELGVNMIHIMPILKCPEGASDGGYAVSDFRQVDPRVGSNEELAALAADLRKREILLILDVVVNHTSREHEWAQKARMSDPRFQAYYYTFPDREIPDMFEHTMPEVFPQTAPGNFTWDADMQRWVMTVFHDYQWDLDYHNPAVFIDMLDIILFWSNQGVDIIRLDAVAFLWKKIGSTCQNERESHLILQLFKDCVQVSAPAVLFIAEAIVAPVEVIKYFGEDAINAKECEIAYNATFMALLWDAIATKNTRLLWRSIQNLPAKLERATWLNYIRCHDDIGLGFDDSDIAAVGYEPKAHRRFLIDYYTGGFSGSDARGIAFGENKRNGDARIAGSLSSLAGLEHALQSGDAAHIDHAISRILLLHGLILSFGGIPLLYYGDELGTLNDYSYRDNVSRTHDSRWVNRPKLDWNRAEKRHEPGTIEYRVFTALKKLIAIRKEIPAFADFNNRSLLETADEHIFAFSRFTLRDASNPIVVVANFDVQPHGIASDEMAKVAGAHLNQFRDVISGEVIALQQGKLMIPELGLYWLRVGH
ncbi:alpha-amylase [Nitrosomonas sp. JL21]|uniref:alpha-amylase family protein n=1 Tax=Nitrosomonas sp. JL21 TaxID=153949 RepID=UPI00136B5629|nr:alpha-amylase family protein [Nitrosomonas sp. JL21]MBL8498411.1 alpha-amylase family protein [Nitrosomonas sp.]MCC7090839.1 alpha-amylase family protein [Nitrosomonas sp.]MXS77611.1 alpha-amylase [Nitrosomonas sp. JL21]